MSRVRDCAKLFLRGRILQARRHRSSQSQLFRALNRRRVPQQRQV